jgi:pimeloyl-ACP methyl ester carboxylesterase
VGSGSPLVCLHGFLDSPRTWDLVRPALERRHELLAPALAGHAGGPPLACGEGVDTVVDHVERAMDAAGIATAHLVGNSLGGHVALRLAERDRARSVVAFAPAGGWAAGDASLDALLDRQAETHRLLRAAAPHADALVATPEGRRRVTRDLVATAFEHIPAELLAHQIRAGAACEASPLLASARRGGWTLAPELIRCPVRVAWGTADALLPWPSAAKRYRATWLPHADWVELDGVGHCPQLEVPLEAAQLILGVTG